MTARAKCTLIGEIPAALLRAIISCLLLGFLLRLLLFVQFGQPSCETLEGCVAGSDRCRALRRVVGLAHVHSPHCLRPQRRASSTIRTLGMSARFSCTRLGGFIRCVEKSRVLGWPGGLRVETWPLRANGTYVRSLAVAQRLLAVNILPAGALLAWAQVVIAPAIGDCEILNGLEFLADPTAIGKPVNDPPAHVTLTADQAGVIERVFSAIGPAS